MKVAVGVRRESLLNVFCEFTCFGLLSVGMSRNVGGCRWILRNVCVNVLECGERILNNTSNIQNITTRARTYKRDLR